MKKYPVLLFFLIAGIVWFSQLQPTQYPAANNLVILDEANFGKTSPSPANLLFLYNANGGSFWRMRPNDTKSPLGPNMKAHPSGIRFERLPIVGSGPGGSISVSQIQDLAKVWPPRWSDLLGVPDEIANAMGYINFKQNKIQWISNNTPIGTPGQFRTLKLMGDGFSATTSSDTLRVNIFGNKIKTPEDYGAYGDSIHNDRDAIQAWANANKNGKVALTAGKKYRITGTVTITGTGDEKNSLHIEGHGAKIVTTNNVNTPVLIFDDCMRTKVTGVEIAGTTDFDGWYFGACEDVYFNRVRFGNQNLDVVDETYWSRWVGCVFKNGMYIHTGTSGDRTEFNANTFYNCNIWFGDYNISLYGDQTAQNVSFYNCDISYPQVGRMYIDQTVLDAQINFYSCYFDDNFDVPLDSKNVVINTYGFGNNPNSGNIGQHATLATGSQNDVSSSFGGRTGSRSPMGAVNILTNGDLRGGLSNINSDWASMAMVDGPGAYGQYAHFTDASGSLKSAEWTSIEAPYDGYYAVTVIGRNVGGTAIVFSNVVEDVDVYYNPVSVNHATNFVVSTGKVKLVAGQRYKLRVFNAPGTSNSLDIAYAAVTYGRTGGLMAPAHPHAESIKAVQSYYQGTSLGNLYTLPIVDNERISAKCTCYGWDPTYPDGSTYNDMIILANKSGGTLTYSLTSQTAIKVGDISAAPTYALSTSGSNLLLNVTPADGLIRLNCELKGVFRQ